jgi:hypothetical protein
MTALEAHWVQFVNAIAERDAAQDQRVVIVDKGGYCISAAKNDISTNQIV